MNHIFRILLYIGILFIIVSCGSNKTKPEDEIYDFVAHAEQLIEDHQGRKAKQLIADNYNDEKKRSKKDIEQLITYYLFRHQTIHILQQTTEIVFSSDSNCSVTVYAAMAGRSGELKEMLKTLQTDVYKFTFILSKANSSWKVSSANWQRASTDDISKVWGSLSQ